MNIMLISVMCGAFLFPIIGKICDIIEPTKIVPYAFFLRSASCATFTFLVNRPDTLLAYGVCVTMIIGTVIENISIDSIFNKNLPKESRGVLNGLYSFAGQFGILVFSFFAGWAFDQIDTKAPFIAVGVLDLLFAILCVYMKIG